MTKRVFTIPPDAVFIDRLAEGVWRAAGKDPFKLTEMLVLLPTRRACRSLCQAFPRVTGMRANLLPRLRPIGDSDESELSFTLDGTLNLVTTPAISPLRRQLLLARLIAASDKEMPLDQAVQLADALAKLLDEVQIATLDFTGLDKLVPDIYALHWQETLKFLKPLTAEWPKILVDEGVRDPAERRNYLLATQAEQWRKKSPAFPIFAAGSTGSQPATAELLNVIASMPSGTVILPGLDKELAEDAWQAIEDTHPQYALKKLLERFGVERKDVKNWPNAAKKDSSRARLLQESMRPAEVTEGWRTLSQKFIPRSAVKGLSFLTLDTVQNEALAIALRMRETLEQPGKTVSLVTADRDLAERVANELKRWGVTVNDSAGAALAAQPASSFLLDVLAVVAPQATPIEYLSFLKHPLASLGLEPPVCRARAREAEVLIWRADGPPKGETETIRDWLDRLKKLFQPMTDEWHKKHPFVTWLQKHRELAVACAATPDKSGDTRLWSGQAGEETAEWLSDLQSAAFDFPPLDGDAYARLFTGLLRAVTMRPSYGQHPRARILGLLEARLIEADVMILGGLNEGSWPPLAAIDPWMSRPMKEAFGLPSPERRIGLSAHDFVQLASAPHVMLTRSRRAGSAPTVPSRFLLQLEAVLHALGYEDATSPDQPWDAWALSLDQPAAVKPCRAPEPRPPVALRPRRLQVTEIGTWRRNPYAIYARHVLRLRKLDPLERAASAADKGNIIHQALDVFLRKHLTQLPKYPLLDLLSVGRETFAPFRDDALAMAFWWPRFEKIAAWFVAREHERRAASIRPLKTEAEGEIYLHNDFTLKGRADRIDRFGDGSLAIIDYKTGSTPKLTDVRYGLEPQLPLLALIASLGGFKDVPKCSVSQLAYWKLSGDEEAGEEIIIKDPVDALVKQAQIGLENLITLYADATMPYRAVPKPGLQPRYDDYAHLARLAEWGRTTEDA